MSNKRSRRWEKTRKKMVSCVLQSSRYIKGLQNQIKIGGMDYNVSTEDTLTLKNADISVTDEDNTLIHLSKDGSATFAAGKALFNKDGKIEFILNNIYSEAIKIKEIWANGDITESSLSGNQLHLNDDVGKASYSASSINISGQVNNGNLFAVNLIDNSLQGLVLRIILRGLPTDPVGLLNGQLWNNNGALNIV